MYSALVLLLISIPFAAILQGYALFCHMCDTIGESNCLSSICVGTACIKRVAIINGLVRVQKFCQQTSDPLIEYCDNSVLWKGGVGIECICQRDYCNGARNFFPNLIISSISLILNML